MKCTRLKHKRNFCTWTATLLRSLFDLQCVSVQATLAFASMAVGHSEEFRFNELLCLWSHWAVKLQTLLDCVSVSPVFIPEGKVGWTKIRHQHSTATAQTLTHGPEGLRKTRMTWMPDNVALSGSEACTKWLLTNIKKILHICHLTTLAYPAMCGMHGWNLQFGD